MTGLLDFGVVGYRGILMILFSVLLLVSPVNSLIDQICVNLGYENLRNDPKLALYYNKSGTFDLSYHQVSYCQAQHKVGDYAPVPARKSSASIGGQKYAGEQFGPAVLSLHKSSLGIAVSNTSMPDCCRVDDTSKAKIFVYGGQIRDKFLPGWLGIEVDIQENVVWAFVQVSDENGNAIGELVTYPEYMKCFRHITDAYDADIVVYPKPEQYLPCTATGLQEAKPSQSVVYTRKDTTDSYQQGTDMDGYLASPPKPWKGFNTLLTWRLNEYYCNRHAKFQVMLYFLTEADAHNTANPTTILQRSDWFYPKWYGVADIIPKYTAVHFDEEYHLDCMTLVTEKVAEGNFWIERVEPLGASGGRVNSEREGPGFPPTLYNSCRTYLTRLQEFTSYVEKQPSYGGRCETMSEKKFKPAFYKNKRFSTSSVDVPHQCLKNEKAPYPPDMEDYEVYMKKIRENRKAVCNPKGAKCPSIKDKTFEEILQVATANGPTLRPNATGRYILKSRAYHGMMSTWTFLFLLPILNFVARYFKETFLSTDIIGLRVWYFIHLFFPFLMLCFFSSGLVSNRKVTRVWGSSWSAAAAQHRHVGWACTALFGVLLLSGPFRPTPIRCRLIFMSLHAFLGYLLYILGLFTLANSALIPGSPSATTCYKNISFFDPFVSPTLADLFHHEITTTVTEWFFIDVFFHVLMHVMQCLADRTWQVKRSYYFPLVPIVGIRDRRSFKCFRYRTLILILYVLILGVMSAETCVRLYDTDWYGCDCGPLSCTHANLSAESRYPEVQCGRLAAIRKLQKNE